MCILLTNDNELLVVSGLAKAEATYLVTVTQAGLQALPLEIAGSSHYGVTDILSAATIPFPNSET